MKFEEGSWIFEELTEEYHQAAREGTLKGTDMVQWKCPEHGVYTQRFNNHVKSDGTKGQGCRRCASARNVLSRAVGYKENVLELIPEIDGSQMLRTQFREFIENLHKETLDCSILDSKVLDYEVDYYNTNKKVAVKYIEGYRYAEVGPDNTVKRSNKSMLMDLFYKFEADGIRLIFVQDHMWFSRQKQMKEVIIDASKDSEERIYARNTDILKIDKKLCREFHERYHIDGSQYNFEVAYGIVRKGDIPSMDTLLQAMSFSYRRFAGSCENQSFEVGRMAARHGITVVGGTSKLLRKFIDDYKPRHIISYSANTWFNGKGYDNIGFTTTGDCGGCYGWVEYDMGLPMYRTRESLQVKKLKINYPDLYQEVMDNPQDYVSGVENAMCSALNMYKCNNSGNKRHEMLIYYDNDPREFRFISEADTSQIPYYGGDYKGHIPHGMKLMDDIPDCYRR